MKTYQFIYNLLRLKGIGRAKANKILQRLEGFLYDDTISIETILSKSDTLLTQLQIDEIFNLKNEIKIIDKYPEICFLNLFNSEFPKSLKKLKSNCPPILTCMGNLGLLNAKKVGFCGSRKASEKGLTVAKDIAQQISSQEIVVVSGYASGIDQETHYWALKEGGATIVVLPEGIQNFTIKKHMKDVWDWNRVLVISEFIPDAIWSVNRAMQRNTTIIALSDIMVLIEAKEKGGSIDAGYKTLQMNKPLFTPVFQGIPEEASGIQLLLTKGALPVMKKRESNRANLNKLINMLNNRRVTENTLFE